MDFFLLKNTNDQSRNFAPYLERYFVDLLGDSNRHLFVHDNRSMFHAFSDGHALNIIHAGSDPRNYATDGKPFATLALDNLAELLRRHGAIHFVAVDVPTKITDLELLGRMRFAYQDPDGVFLDAGSGKPLTESPVSATVAIMSAFKAPTIPLHTIFLHYPFASAKYAPPFRDEKHLVETVLENESLKLKVFPMEFTSGTQRVLDGNVVFCADARVKLKLVSDAYRLLLAGADWSKVFKIETNLRWSFLPEEGALEIDFGAASTSGLQPLSIQLETHDFLRRWIYEDQRFEFNFLLHKA